MIVVILPSIMLPTFKCLYSSVFSLRNPYREGKQKKQMVKKGKIIGVSSIVVSSALRALCVTWPMYSLGIFVLLFHPFPPPQINSNPKGLARIA